MSVGSSSQIRLLSVVVALIIFGLLAVNWPSEKKSSPARSAQAPQSSRLNNSPRAKSESNLDVGERRAVEVNASEHEASGPTFSEDFKIPAVVRAELRLTAQEVFQIEKELEKARALLMKRRHERSRTIDTDKSHEPRFFIPADREFGESLKGEFADAVNKIVDGGTRSEAFRKRLETDTQFASWGAYETHIRIVDPQAEGKEGPLRAEVRELDPETGELIRRVSGGLQYITHRYGIELEVEAAGTDVE